MNAVRLLVDGGWVMLFMNAVRLLVDGGWVML
jgi:hypothetical protein